MIKKIRLIINTILYHPFIFLSLIFEMLFIIFFSLNSVNYISSELAIVNFTEPFSKTNFICYMPVPDFLYDGSISYKDALQNGEQENRRKTYSSLSGLESYSKVCSFGAENSDGVFEIRAISGNVLENINISLKKGKTLKNQPKTKGVINCIISDGSFKIGDTITVLLLSDYAEDTKADALTLRVGGIMNPPYFNLNPLTSGVEHGLSDIFTFTPQEELSAFDYSIIWVDYDDIADFIEENDLDKDKNSPIYSQLLFFNSNLTENQMQENKKILEKNGYVYDYETSADFKMIKEYTETQFPLLICMLTASVIGLAVMVYLNVFLIRRELIIYRTCGATEKDIFIILSGMFFLAIILADLIAAILMPLLIYFETVDIDISFVKYNVIFIVLLNLIFIVTSLSVSALCQRNQTKTKDEFND